VTFRLLVRLRRPLLAGGLTVATLATSCIREADFVVVNSSDQSLVVTLTPVRKDCTDPRGACPDQFAHPPLATGPAIAELERRVVWVPVDTALLQYRRHERRIELTLPPHTVLRVDRPRSNPDGEFYVGGLSLWTLELAAPGLHEVWTPSQILEAFKPRSRSLYVYEFRG
jgi:hypothetical protein